MKKKFFYISIFLLNIFLVISSFYSCQSSNEPLIIHENVQKNNSSKITKNKHLRHDWTQQDTSTFEKKPDIETIEDQSNIGKVFFGTHKLHMIKDSSYLIVYPDNENNLKTSFMWTDNNENISTNTLPFDRIKFKYDPSMVSPCVKFRWRKTHNEFKSEEAINYVVYALIIHNKENISYLINYSYGASMYHTDTMTEE